MGYNDIDYSVTDGRAEILFDRPSVMNAYTEKSLIEINHALEEALGDDRVYAILLSGTGSGFCTGRDLQEGTKTDSKLSEIERLGKVGSIIRQLHSGSKPTVAGINGPAVGGGMEIALACDFRVMSDTAFLRDGHTDAGFTPATSGAWLLPRLIGEARAKQVTLLGDDIDAEMAVEWGLAIDAVPESDLLERTRIVANRLRDKPATALQESKSLFDPTISSLEEHAQVTVDARWACQDVPESREARKAISEGRDPKFDREY